MDIVPGIVAALVVLDIVESILQDVHTDLEEVDYIPFVVEVAVAGTD